MRSINKLFYFLVLFCLGSCVEKVNQSEVQPNILMIMCDDLGWGDVGFNGNSIIQTPNLDHLAQKGMVFNRFYSSSPVCSPTRASCLTGRHPFRMGIYGANTGHLPAEEITIAEILQQEGYTTGHFGKWHLGTLTTTIRDANRGRPGDSTHYAIPSDHGFDTYFCTESKVPTWDPMTKPLVFDTSRGESLRFGWAAIDYGEQQSQPYGTYYWTGPEVMDTQNLNGDNSRVIMDRVIPFIQSANQANQPFYANIWFHTPHLPLVTSSKLRDLYSNRSHQEQLLFGAITAMDEQVGRLWSELEKLGIAQETIIWFCSDNGPERGTPGSAGPFRERKRSLHDGGIRVPAFCVWEGQVPSGSKTDFPVVTHDYLPTLLNILAVEYPVSNRILDGMDVGKILQGVDVQREKPIGFQHHNQQVAWMSGDYKLYRRNQNQPWELYHMLKDKEESNDLAQDLQDLVKELRQELDQWIESCHHSDQGEEY